MTSRALFRVPCLLALAACGAAIGAFEPPGKEARTAAAGSLRDLDAKLRRAFSDHGEFQAKKAPGNFDWLAAHPEPEQTYARYVASRPNLPDRVRKKLYILPLGDFANGTAPDLKLLEEYTAACYHPMPVALLPAVQDREVPAKERENAGRTQWKSTDILAWLPRRLPPDAYAMIAVTMTDLYPDESWNFVFGQASTRNRVGVFSFARYQPDDGADGDAGKLVLRRAAKILTHEMGHMFGIRHCIHYECNMNGANHLQEADSTPMALCPVCLRKLRHAIRFDPVTRYGEILRFYQENRFEAEAEWTGRRLEAIRNAR